MQIKFFYTGGSDDEVYISIYQFGDYEEDRIIVMRIHLGTGETIAEIFPIDGHYSFQTGRLFSKNKNAIVLEIRNPTSNYGAAQIFVIDVIAGGTDSDHPSASAVVRLDTTVHTAAEPFALVSGERTLDFNAVTFGTQIVHVRNRPLQGLKIYLADSEGEWHKRYEILTGQIRSIRTKKMRRLAEDNIRKILLSAVSSCFSGAFE